MLPVNLTTPAFAPLRPPAPLTERIAASAAISETDKTKLTEQTRATEAMKASMKTARDEARSQVKARAREAVKRLQDEFKLIRKLWAGNPKEMARQLARLAKQLKQALSDYAGAAKENNERGMDAREVLTSTSAADTAAAKGDTQQDAKQDPPQDPEAAKAVAAYEKTKREAAGEELASAEMEARGDKEFTREIRGFLKKLREEFQSAKIKAALMAPDRDRTKAFEDANKEFKEIEEDVGDMEKGINDAFPDLDAKGLRAARA